MFCYNFNFDPNSNLITFADHDTLSKGKLLKTSATFNYFRTSITLKYFQIFLKLFAVGGKHTKYYINPQQITQ